VTISFNEIPAGTRVPFVWAEFNAANAQQGPALLTYRALLIGQKTAEGTAPANSLQRVLSADQALTLAGRGSMLHRQALAWFAANKSTEVWLGVLADNGAGVAAAGSLNMTGPANAAGTLSIYLGGQLVQVAVASGDTATVIAAAVASAIGRYASGTVTLSTVAVGDDVTVGVTAFIATAGAVTPGEATYSVDTSDNAAASSLAAQINAHAAASLVAHATASSAVVSLRAKSIGNSLALATTDAVHAAVSGATLTGYASTDLPVIAYAEAGVVTLIAKNTGACGNEIDVRLNYRDTSEALPSGVAVVVGVMTSGATNPVLTSLITAMGDVWFHAIAHPYTDATSLTSLEAEMASRSAAPRMIDGVAISAKAGTAVGALALGASRNSPSNCILFSGGIPNLPCEVAAGAAGIVAVSAAQDPALPLQTLVIPGILSPAQTDQLPWSTRDQLLRSGIATVVPSVDGTVALERLITTYQRNAVGSPDVAYLDATTRFTLMYLRYSFVVRMARFARYKLAHDGIQYAAGQAVMTPRMGKAEALAWFQDMINLALVEDLTQFKRDLVVEMDATDVNRLNFLLPPDLINQLIGRAAKMSFLL
jgi:phage tail sheath gpL-like